MIPHPRSIGFVLLLDHRPIATRWFLSWVAAVLFLSTAATCLAAELTKSEVQGAEKVIGLEFTEAEQRQVLGKLQELLQSIHELRNHPIPNSLPPALLFDPRPVGYALPPAGEPFAWPTIANAKRPVDQESWAFLSIRELASLLRAREVTSEELTRFALGRLKRFGPALRCVVTLTEERALASARAADHEIREGRWRGLLHGIPYGVKDLLDVSNTPTTWGVAYRTNTLAQEDATVVRKLEAAGAVLVAKLSLGELAMGDVWFGGTTRNPWRPESGSSGSSAGSASAVAAGLLPFALGSETLGSIVSPATVCGVTGLRPTYGRVSRSGAMTLTDSMDKLGPIARSVEDTAIVLEAIRGSDNADRSVVDAPLNRVPSAVMRRLRIGFLEQDMGKSYPNQTNDLASLEILRGLGWTLKPLKLPEFPKNIFYASLAAEAAAAFDDLTRSHLDDTLVQQSDGSWPNSFRAARFMTAVDYLQAQKIRSRLLESARQLFTEVDVIVAPSWRGNQLLFSNLTGLPCVVVPNGPLASTHPPSLCFLAGLFREGDAIAVAEAYQKATSWHRQQPDLKNLASQAPR